MTLPCLHHQPGQSQAWWILAARLMAGKTDTKPTFGVFGSSKSFVIGCRCRLSGTEPTLDGNGPTTALSDCAYAVIPRIVFQLSQAQKLQSWSNIVGKAPPIPLAQSVVASNRIAVRASPIL